ncbi:MAG: PhzF family phenazine biosynthesis protein [Solirubrobacteraceae bacterium]|jgi:trans-2,3-dihydro-3-hydroxyanthranilate isomerase
MSGETDAFAAINSFREERGRWRGALRYVVVDVFTETPLEGNQLAVFTDGRGLSQARMQRLARELNVSETVFVLPPERGGDARIRIFTPVEELPFAGHPVLGSAIVIATAMERASLTLETASGLVPLVLQREGEQVRSGTMQQPIPSVRPYEREAELLDALGVERSCLPVEAYSNGPLHVYVELDSEQAVAALTPDLRALAALGPLGASCFAGGGRRWRTRMFAPALGVPEDPATGSAAGPLAVHLSRHGRVAFGDEIEIRQGAEIGRPSLLHARVEGSAERIERVEVGGSAVIVARGEFVPT